MAKLSKQFNKEILPILEKKYNIQYPVLQNATYKSLVNYATDLKSPIQRWYRYKEGYSVKLMQQLFDEHEVKKGDIILDPFCGSGSTLIQGKTIGLKGIGFEVNPFSAFLAKAKTQNYDNFTANDFKKISKKILLVSDKKNKLKKPNLSTIDKLFQKDVLNYLLNLKYVILKIKNEKTRDLFFLAWLSILEDASNYRKAGNGLKIRAGKTLLKRDLKHAKDIFKNRIREIEEDLPYAIKISEGISEPILHQHTSLEADKFVKNRSVTGVIFSPPYANCFDYTEIYKIELWLGGFIKEYHDLKGLRKNAVRSHLNGYKAEDNKINQVEELKLLVDALGNVKLWDDRIPSMVKSYFTDMFVALDKIYKSLKPAGFCAIIVSNSAYGGIVVPTDLLLAKYAEKIGFNVTKIEVARFIITSSQQYKKTEKYRKYLHESIIHLQK